MQLSFISTKNFNILRSRSRSQSRIQIYKDSPTCHGTQAIPIPCHVQNDLFKMFSWLKICFDISQFGPQSHEFSIGLKKDKEREKKGEERRGNKEERSIGIQVQIDKPFELILSKIRRTQCGVYFGIFCFCHTEKEKKPFG